MTIRIDFAIVRSDVKSHCTYFHYMSLLDENGEVTPPQDKKRLVRVAHAGGRPGSLSLGRAYECGALGRKPLPVEPWLAGNLGPKYD
eukprot:6186808-Pleurochrysis_carterae.AAC.2